MFSFFKTDIIKVVNNNDVELVKKIIPTVNIDFRDKNGRTAIFYACINGNYEMCKTLIDNGAEIDIVDDRNLKPIHYAVMVNNSNIIQLLTSHCKYDLKLIKSDLINIELKDKRHFLNLIKKVF